MEVHHHSHTERKKWTHYFWEFLMLFLAVTLGFLVENQREHFIENKRAKGYARMLKLDLQNDTLSLNNLINTLTNESLSRDFVTGLVDKDINNITISELRRKDTITFLIDDFLPNNATLEQMKTSGELRYFENIELKGMLAYYEWSIKHFLQMKRDIESVYGGISSEHFLQYEVKMEEFIKKSEHADSSISALKAGYKFDSWLENKKITELRFFFKSFLKERIYPDLKRQAVDIIVFLNKEYHLK